ncbi:hypothetical protein [Actinomyces oris]|uniref:variant leucine-rich repeat-containing protein n=1 Tax=Actinomyces oris TaxID=544580 RepID=UPI0028D68E39|nr:hypothetical protein [Actinomyces oris]
MTTGHSPSAGDYDATTALSRFASPQDLERIAETRPDLHSILATNPSIPPRVREMLEQSDDAVVREVLARQAGRGAQSAPPTQSPVPGGIGPMAPTMAVGTAAGTIGVPPQQPVSTSSGYAQAPQGYGGHQPGVPSAAPQGGSLQGASPQGYGAAAAQAAQGPLPQAPQAAQLVAPQPAALGYSAPAIQSSTQPADEQTAMPPGVPSRVPSEYVLGHGQPDDSGPAYGPGQPVAPAYGTPMYAPPVQAPKKRRLLKVVAVVLPIILVLGAGGAAAWYFLGRSEVSLASPFVTPSEAWLKGASKAWSADVAANKDPYVIGGHFLTLDTSDGTLTGYTPLGDNMEEAWQATLNDEDLTSTYQPMPGFQTWGNNTLVYKSTLIDMKTGKVSSAPWKEGKSAIIADNIAISCNSSDKCTAWDSPAKQKWTREIPGTGEMSSKTYYRNDSTLTRGGRRYAWVYNAIINIDNGETLILGGGSKVDSDLTSTFFKDGWGTFEVKNGESEADDTDSDSPWSTTYKVTIYDFTGKKRSSFTETITLGEQVVIGESELITAEEYRTYFKDQDYSKAKLTSKVNANGCITKLKPKDGKPISIQPPDNSSGLSYDSISPSCASVATSPQGSDIVRLATLGRGDINGLTMLMNIKTGEEITFNGIDWKNGDSLIIAKPDLIIGYNKIDGKVIGFKPGS